MSVNYSNNNCSSGSWLMTPRRYEVFAGVYSVVLMVGLPLNALSLWILLKRHGLTSSNVVIMTSLAVSDILLTLFLPLRIYYSITKSWPFGALMCTIAATMHKSNIETSSIFITFLSVDRLMALVYPLRSRGLRRPMVTLAVCVCIWICVAALSTPHAMRYTERLRDIGGDRCYVIGDGKKSMYGVLATLLPLLILLHVNVLSTVLVSRTLYRRHVEHAEENMKGIMMIFVMNMLMFLVFFMPFAVVMFLFGLDILCLEIVEFTVCHVSINCCLDPIVYYYSLSALAKRRTAGRNP